MKCFFILCACLGLSFSLSAQQNDMFPTDYECLYEYTIQVKDGVKESYSTILQIGTACAYFTDYTSYQLDSVRCASNPDEKTLLHYGQQVLHNEFFFDQSVLQNYPKGKKTVYSVITPDYYRYEERNDLINWELQNDTTTICGYNCNKATCSYGGRKWMVYYTTEIPVQFGPWKFSGLPGLIMAATDDENIHTFTAIGFRKNNVPISVPKYQVIETTREKFLKSKNRFEENPMKNLPPESISAMTVIKSDNGGGAVMINGVQLRMHPNGYIPLEIE